VVDLTTLHLIYTRPAAVTDVAYQVEWASTLGLPWVSTGVTQQILSDDGINRTIRATVLKGGSGQRYLRLKVIR